MPTLLLVRHGETDWNREGRYQGQADPPLNARGRAQAHALGQRLQAEGWRPEVIYTSPLRRAAETAAILQTYLPAPVRVEPRLMEIHQGAWQGLLVDEIAQRWPQRFQAWETAPWTVRPPGGESLAEVRDRVYEAIDELVHRHPDDVVLVVSHRLPLALLKIRYQGYSPDQVRTIPIPNAGYEVLELPSKIQGHQTEQRR
ncbi:MAG: histidine phosphatase family protein [Chloroflexi bacterium]|nr:histidine phosphatase family protein [Chloroflexota bacterium]